MWRALCVVVVGVGLFLGVVGLASAQEPTSTPTPFPTVTPAAVGTVAPGPVSTVTPFVRPTFGPTLTPLPLPVTTTLDFDGWVVLKQMLYGAEPNGRWVTQWQPLQGCSSVPCMVDYFEVAPIFGDNAQVVLLPPGWVESYQVVYRVTYQKTGGYVCGGQWEGIDWQDGERWWGHYQYHTSTGPTSIWWINWDNQSMWAGQCDFDMAVHVADWPYVNFPIYEDEDAVYSLGGQRINWPGLHIWDADEPSCASYSVEVWLMDYFTDYTRGQGYPTPTPTVFAEPTEEWGVARTPAVLPGGDWGHTITPEPIPFTWEEPTETVCYDLLPVVNVDQSVLGLHIAFAVPRLRVCLAEYQYALNLLGVDVGGALVAFMGFGAIAMLYGIFRRV